MKKTLFILILAMTMLNGCTSTSVSNLEYDRDTLFNEVRDLRNEVNDLEYRILDMEDNLE